MLNKDWLPQFTNDMIKNAQARNDNLCAYLIALEGWRRGLTLTWYSEKVKKQGLHAPGRVFTLSDGEKIHRFYKAKGDKVGDEAQRITGNKERAKTEFRKHNVPVPEGRRFQKSVVNSEIIQYVEELGFPVVLKPTSGYQGIGVVANIQDIEHLKNSLVYVREELGYGDVLIEQHIPGDEYRVFVVEDKVIAAINRIPANVIGDGIQTIKELIAEKNKERRKNPRLFTCLIKIDYEIENTVKRAGYTLENVPEKGEQLFLRENSNISTGGDSVDVMDELSEEIKQIAINTLKAIPDLPHGGVDIIINTNPILKHPAYVLEINAIPQIGSLVFPMFGTPRNVPKAIVDYYFPDTIDASNYNPHVYFDFKAILEPLQSKVAEQVIVTPAPKGPTYAKKFIVKGKVQGVGYRNWIRRRALEADLYGYAQNRANGDVHVFVAGDQDVVENFKSICLKGPARANVDSLTDERLNIAVKVGFEIKGDQKKPVSPQLPVQQKNKGKLKKTIKKALRIGR